MDCIDRAIKKGSAVSTLPELNSSTWERFEQAVRGRKLFLYGVGAAIGVFLKRNQNRIIPEGVIDQDPDKQGLNVRDLSEDAWEYLQKDVPVSPASLLDKYEREQIVVLICSLRYGDEIATELLEKGIAQIYSLLCMEAKEREKTGEMPERTAEEELLDYTERCLCREIQKRKLVFRAIGNYADHGKYITEALLRTGEPFDLVWMVSDLHANVPEGVRKVWTANRRRMIYEYETAEMWISDLPLPDGIIKREGQIYIQTKHWASVTLKRFYLDTKAFREEPEKLALWKRESRLIDYIITGSEFDKEACQRGFQADCKFIEAGSPRSDAMFRPEEMRRRVADGYGFGVDKKLLLYAPTYRFDAGKGNSVHTVAGMELDFALLREALSSRFGGEWLILLRLHPSVRNAYDAVSLPEFVVNVSEYADSQELAAAADILISDYSSIMFEPAFVGKPVFLFATDIEAYIEKEYDLLMDYRSLPFPIAESEEQLASCIREFDRTQYQKAVDAFLAAYGVREDGHASERTAQAICEILQKTPQVTILMPALNVGSYIRECMQSVVEQTFQDMEILVIDAGSTDGTLEILQEYEKRDSRIRVLHSEKKSYGYQMNLGIQAARGAFLGVVETDDYIEKDMVETLCRAMQQGGYDYVKGTARAFRKIGKDIVITNDIGCTPKTGIPLCPKEHPELFVTDRFLWLGLYRTDFVRSIRLNETPGAAYQDIGFLYQAQKKAVRALYLDKLVYHYRQDNLNASGYNHKAFRFLSDEFSVILERETDERWLGAVYRKLTEQSLSRFQNMAVSGCYWKEYEQEMNRIRKWVLQAVEKGLLEEEKLSTTNRTLLAQWKQGNESLYQYCRSIFDGQRNRLRACIQQTKDRRIVIFGAGRYGRFAHALLENCCPGRAVAYCDNKQELWGTKQQGLFIYRPEDAVSRFTDAVFVIAVSVREAEADSQLAAQGVGAADRIRYCPDYNYLLFQVKD